MGDPRWYQAWLDKAAQDKAQGIDISAILNRRIDAQINAKEKANGSAPESGLPELFINESDPTETAKELAILIARRGDLLSNGVVQIPITMVCALLPMKYASQSNIRLSLVAGRMAPNRKKSARKSG